MANDEPTSMTEPGLPEQTDDASSAPSFLAGRRKWAILVAGLLIIVAGGLAWVNRGPAPSPSANTNTSVNPTNTGSGNRTPTFRQVTVPTVADADKDGLTDAREAELTTNPALPDSDGDELSDYDEVTVYGTNPLDQDSDDDGFHDGVEVRTGNNPTGAGKIIDLPKSISNINTQ